ncbi:esterase-like activity of phytase family protein [Streptomyces sp. TBY4]|uniref:esterase-like activity of phytase family protein n=1 Tax=Streptomyces sp. TBY4 TaxID=2962030 RepID=UPI0020B719C2|nr:esterase-like activity of phytase family protein [Streptomyces sp. TBY4]MCP3757032.1 esterase-like activity of phytase family protein [Streptomyces sp. TBY4]
MLQRMAWLTAAATLLTVLAAAPAGADGAWQKVGGDARSGVSGIAFEGRTADGAGVDVLVVHDNKRSGQPRLSRITHREGTDGISPITWDGPEPVDLEAIEAIPGMPGEYLALTGRGIVYRLKVTGATATVVDYSPLPAIGEGDDFESFALVAQNGRLAALWADRGAGADRPATLYAAPLTFAAWGQPLFGPVTRRAYRTPYPTGDGTRHISDIAVTDSGRIITSSASDAGDDGPFDSAVSDAGRVTVSAAGRVRVTLAASPTVLGTFPQYKIEGVECLPGSADALLGTDDENLGGYVRTMPFCAA